MSWRRFPHPPLRCRGVPSTAPAEATFQHRQAKTQSTPRSTVYAEVWELFSQSLKSIPISWDTASLSQFYVNIGVTWCNWCLVKCLEPFTNTLKASWGLEHMKCTLFVASVQVALSRLPYHSPYKIQDSNRNFGRGIPSATKNEHCSFSMYPNKNDVYVYIYICVCVYVCVYIFNLMLIFIFIFIFILVFISSIYWFIILFITLQIQTLGHHAGSISPYGGISSNHVVSFTTPVLHKSLKDLRGGWAWCHWKAITLVYYQYIHINMHTRAYRCAYYIIKYIYIIVMNIQVYIYIVVIYYIYIYLYVYSLWLCKLYVYFHTYTGPQEPIGLIINVRPTVAVPWRSSRAPPPPWCADRTWRRTRRTSPTWARIIFAESAITGGVPQMWDPRNKWMVYRCL